MSKLFNGLKFILIGATSKQRQMISMNIMNEGGLVLPPSSFPLSDNMRNISTNTNDLLNCTHMLLSEHKRVTSTQLCDFLGCSADELNGGVLEQQSLVNCDWVTECIARRQVVGPDAFRVLVVEDDDMKETNSAETASKVKASVEMDSKKRKINEVNIYD